MAIFLELLFSAIDAALERSRLDRARMRAEQEMRDARERAELLLSEVNHRIANSLALVASLVRMQASLVKDTAAAHALSETEGRIKAISGVHRRLYKSTDIGKVALDEYLNDLVADLASSIAADGWQNIIEFEGDSIWVSPDKAVSIGVAVTELVTNAVKYAYSDQSAGRVLVTLSLLPDNYATISVIDEGKGWDGTGTVQGTGLGTRIVNAMMTSLRTKLVYSPRPVGTDASFKFET
ncbi:MAG: sensor histidine kinase [Mesorhizobium sp.]